MFYSTTIKSIGEYGIVDTQGRYLSFIGDLPVKEGDTVYTDGRFIFGHAPPKGSPAIFDEPSGIPALGDEDESGKDELRGYFTTSGKYKRYRVKGDEWITNAEKTYAHDGSFEDVDDENVIDAEIALDDKGNEDGVYTIEKIVGDWYGDIPDDKFTFSRNGYRQRYGETNIEDVLKIIKYDNSLDFDNFQLTHEKSSRIMLASKTEFAKTETTILKPCELIIRKDGKEVSRIDFAKLVKPLDDKAKEIISQVKLPTSEHDSDPDYPPKDEVETRARLENFKIKPDGAWEAIITADILAKRTFAANDVTTEMTPYSHYESTYTEDEQAQVGTITTAWSVTDTKITKSTYSAAACAHCYFTAKIYSNEETPELMESLTDNYPLFFPVFKIHPNENSYATVVDAYWLDYFKNDTMPRYRIDTDKLFADFGDTNSKSGFSSTDYSYPQVDVKINVSFTGSSYVSATFSPWGANLIVDSGASGSLNCIVTVFSIYNSRYMTNAPEYDKLVDDDDIAVDFNFPVQDEYTVKIERHREVTQYGDTTVIQRDFEFGGVFDKDDISVIDGSNEYFSAAGNAHRWNMSIASLKGGGYLFGIHADPDRDIDGELYKIDSVGKVEQVGDGFKNFRLREMKKISKAKK